VIGRMQNEAATTPETAKTFVCEVTYLAMRPETLALADSEEVLVKAIWAAEAVWYEWEDGGMWLETMERDYRIVVSAETEQAIWDVIVQALPEDVVRAWKVRPAQPEEEPDFDER
jgi:hypothetical protein